MTRENHRRVYLEIKQSNLLSMARIKEILRKHHIEYKCDIVKENRERGGMYYRFRTYVFGAEAFKVFDLIDWDFKHPDKNNKLEAIKGLYKLG